MADVVPGRMMAEIEGDFGLWHETFVVRAGDYETLYSSMPRVGLARAGRHVTIAEARDSASQRLFAVRPGAG